MFDVPGIEVTTLELVSQTWRGGRWTHTLYIARPGTVRHPATVFLDITHGASHKHLPAVKRLAETGGTLVAVLTDVPNQPLYGNRYEDDLIAYTFDQYLRGGDDSWPLLLPMTKSAVRAMDAIQAWRVPRTDSRSSASWCPVPPSAAGPPGSPARWTRVSVPSCRR